MEPKEITNPLDMCSECGNEVEEHGYPKLHPLFRSRCLFHITPQMMGKENVVCNLFTHVKFRLVKKKKLEEG